jgi:hypothetical protein
MSPFRSWLLKREKMEGKLRRAVVEYTTEKL